MKKYFNKNLIIGIFIGLSVSVISVYAANKYSSSDITYKNTTVENALNDLYKNNSTANKSFRYNETKKNIEVYNKNLNKWVSIKHYNADIPITGELYSNGKASIDFEKIIRTQYNGISYTLNDDHLLITGEENGAGGGVFTKETVDLSDYSKLIVEGTILSSPYPNSSTGFYTLVSENKYWGSSYEPSNTKILKNTKYNVGDFKQEIDISSLNGEYYIAVGLNQCNVKVTKIELQ